MQDKDKLKDTNVIKPQANKSTKSLEVGINSKNIEPKSAKGLSKFANSSKNDKNKIIKIKNKNRKHKDKMEHALSSVTLTNKVEGLDQK